MERRHQDDHHAHRVPLLVADLGEQGVLGSEEARARILSRTPLKRLGEPEEVADVAAFLLSSASSYMTGSVVTETVFTWPGVGLLVVDAVRSRDFQVVQAVVMSGLKG